MYICQLPKVEQQTIRNKVKNKLKQDGYTGIELDYYVELAMDSKVSDID